MDQKKILFVSGHRSGRHYSLTRTLSQADKGYVIVKTTIFLSCPKAANLSWFPTNSCTGPLAFKVGPWPTHQSSWPPASTHHQKDCERVGPRPTSPPKGSEQRPQTLQFSRLSAVGSTISANGQISHSILKSICRL